MKRILLLVILGNMLQATAQKSGRELVDSLVRVIPASENDTIKLRLYNRIFNTLLTFDTDEALKYAGKGLVHAEKMKWPKGVAVFRSNFGQLFSALGNYDSSIYYFQVALDSYKAAGDKFNMAVTNNNMGVAAQNIRTDYTAAAGYYFKGLQIAEEINDSMLLSLGFDNLAGVYLAQQNLIKALEYENRALIIREKSGTPDQVASSLEVLGKIHFLLKDLPKARSFFERSAEIYQSSGNMAGLASIWSSLSLAYGNDHRSTIEARIKARSAWNEINPLHTTAITNLGNLGVAYLELVKYDTLHTLKYGGDIPDNKSVLLQKAEENLKAAVLLSEQVGSSDLRSFFLGSLAEAQELKGDYKNAYYNFKVHKEIQDSIYSQENKNKIAAAESQIEIDKKNSELKINQLALTNQRKTTLGLTAGLILISVIGFLLFRQSRMRKKNNIVLQQLNTELDTANKVKTKFFAILSHDLRAPIARLSNFLHLQKEAPDLIDPKHAAGHQQKLVSSADALLENMESMLLWSKGQMEHFTPSIKPLLVQDIFFYLRQSFITADNIHFSFENPGNIIAQTDEHYLKTIMTNLTANAVKALQHTAHPEIRWTCSLTTKALQLTIHDNGPGIDPQLFVNTSPTGDDSRYGLGLYIIKDLAKAIHCSITVLKVEKGTSVMLSLPA